MPKTIIFTLLVFVYLTTITTKPALAEDLDDADFKSFESVPFASYSYDTEKLTIALDYQSGWGFRVMKYRFPDRLSLEVAFKTGSPEEFKSSEVEVHDIDSSFLLRDIKATIDSDGMKVIVSSRLSKFPFEYELDDRESEKKLYVHIPLRYSSVQKNLISDGLEYHEITMVDNVGPRKMHVVYCDTSSGRYIPEILTAKDFGRDFMSVSGMASATGAVCAVNGGFYSGDGNHQGLIIREKELISYPKFERPVFAQTSDGRLHIGYLPLRGVLHGPDGLKYHFDAIDTKPSSGQVVLLTPGHPSRISSEMKGSKVVLNDYKVEQVTTEDVDDKKWKYILWASSYRDDFKKLNEGDPVQIEFGLGISEIEIESALGAGPMLVTGGKVNVSNNHDFQKDIMNGRAPRTGLGLTKDGLLMLAVLEGRNPFVSIGGTMEEFADLMQKYGAVIALNLDGGGSSAMVVDGEQKTFTPGRTRGITNAIAIRDLERQYGVF